MATPTLRDAVAVLGAGDPVLAGLIERHGMPPPRRRVASAERFGHLAEIIVYQQLAGRAAAAIHGRLVEALDGEVTAERVGHPARDAEVVRPERLEGCLAPRPGGEGPLRRGRARQDRASLRCRRGQPPDRGPRSGSWSAQMFLIGTLSRLDVWPVGDFGVRAGYARAWVLAEMPSPRSWSCSGTRSVPTGAWSPGTGWRAVEEER